MAVSAGSPMPASHQFFAATEDAAYKQALRALKRLNKGMKTTAPLEL
jgi:hypothetical protein